MRGQPKKYVVRSRSQLAALASGVRLEIVDVLSRSGARSIAEIARILGRRPDSLYYHVRMLERAGLLRSAGRRKTSNATEALYRTVAPSIEVDAKLSRSNGGKALVAIVGAMMRLGTRDYRRAVHDSEVVMSGRGQEVVVSRTTGWLTTAQLPEVRRAIVKLGRSGKDQPGNGRLYAITILFTPLVPNRRTSKKRKSK